MNTEVCCSPLPYGMAASRPREVEVREALITKVARAAKATAQFMKAMAQQLADQQEDSLRLAQYIAMEHWVGRL